VGAYHHGVHYVPLGAVPTADLLVPAVADALRFTFYGRTEPQEQLLNYLREKEMLLVLDGFEHLLEGEGLVEEMVGAAPDVKVVVTSRERLAEVGDWTLEVGGLEYPDEGEGVEGYSAVELFVQRARQVRAGFELDGQGPAVVEICRLVEGMPLAIELAAAWVRERSCEQILGEVERGLEILRTTLRDVPERQRSLRATFEHSWALLSEEERAVFGKLAVFRGGVREEAAMQVAGASGDTLTALVGKSLLRRDDTGRYEMHAMVRQYAEEKLEKEVGEHEEVREQHCAYYADFLRQRERDLEGERQQETLGEIAGEVGNVRAAWNWAVKRGEWREINRSLESVHRFYEIRGPFREGVEVFGNVVAGLEGKAARAEEPGEEENLILARVLARQAVFCNHSGLPEQAEELAQRSLTIFRSADVRREMAFSLNVLGIAARFQGEFAQSRAYHQESLAIWREVGDRWDIAKTLSHLGRPVWLMGDYAEAMQSYEESLTIRREIGDRFGIAASLDSLGNTVADLLGKYKEAIDFHREALAIRRELGHGRGVANTLNNMATSFEGMGDLAQAQKLHRESMAVYREIGDLQGVALSLVNQGNISCKLGDYSEARRLLQAGLQVCHEINNPYRTVYALYFLGDVALGVEEYEEAGEHYRAALKLSMQIQSTPLALACLFGVATVLEKVGGQERAVEVLALIPEHPSSIRETVKGAERLLSELESQLPAQVMAEALERGKAREFEEVVEGLLAEV
jgi:predicted ATPase